MSETTEICDEIMLMTTTRFSIRDRLRILFGQPVEVTTWGLGSKVDKPEVLEALRVVESRAFVPPLFYLRRRGGYVVEEPHV